jgi:adenylate cyclase
MSESENPEAPAPPEAPEAAEGEGEAAATRTRKMRESARRTDSSPQLVATAKFLRRLLPGDQEYGDALSTSGDELSSRLGRMVSEAQNERPSAVRELGLGMLQAWETLTDRQKGQREVDVAILFTDLVGFSTWALEAGDEAALQMLRAVGTAEEAAITAWDGVLVKRLGDGAMAVFDTAEAAIQAALELQRRLGEIEVQGRRPVLRAGVHMGRPRKVGGDFLGVDVNVAARVGDAAKGGEVLVSDAACEALDEEVFTMGRRRRLRAPGAPRDLVVRTVDLRG